MLKTISALLCASLLLLGTLLPGHAQTSFPPPITPAQAATVAQNWINLVIAVQGHWGGAGAANLRQLMEFKEGDRVVGYFAAVHPQGFLTISLYRELAPVKAYSDVSDLDPGLDNGLTALLKARMAHLLERLETGWATGQPVPLEVDYAPAWSRLERPTAQFGTDLDADGSNYREGQVMLTSAWNQSPPYNDDCPWQNCGNANGRAIVGCVATAGCQLMRYWNWPPYGSGSPYSDTYDWVNMPDTITISSPAAQIDAIAELCHEVGVAVDMDYGCTASGADTDDMEDVYEDHFRYSTACTRRDRDDYGAVAWFDRLKAQFNLNRPVQYRVEGHSIVGDGWQEIYWLGTLTRQYHMNYGWSASDNAWYTLDALPLGGVDEEYMLENIYPAQSLGGYAAGIYARNASFPYRYVDRDTTGVSATFQSGQNIQFLPGVSLRGTSTTGGYIRIEASPGLTTRLFMEGDLTRGIRLSSGVIRLTNQGSIVLR